MRGICGEDYVPQISTLHESTNTSYTREKMESEAIYSSVMRVVLQARKVCRVNFAADHVSWAEILSSEIPTQPLRKGPMGDRPTSKTIALTIAVAITTTTIATPPTPPLSLSQLHHPHRYYYLHLRTSFCARHYRLSSAVLYRFVFPCPSTRFSTPSSCGPLTRGVHGAFRLHRQRAGPTGHWGDTQADTGGGTRAENSGSRVGALQQSRPSQGCSLPPSQAKPGWVGFLALSKGIFTVSRTHL